MPRIAERIASYTVLLASVMALASMAIIEDVEARALGFGLQVLEVVLQPLDHLPHPHPSGRGLLVLSGRPTSNKPGW